MTIALLFATLLASSAGDLAGPWRAVLSSPGGELPFTLRVDATPDGPRAVILNASEEAPVSSVARDGARVVFRFEGYDSEIAATLSPDGRRLAGEWTRTGAGGAKSRLAFEAWKGDTRRFGPAKGGPLEANSLDPAGAWAVEFVDETGESPARAEFRRDGKRLLGTFLTPTGDYRFLEGDFEDGRLRLSTFDGAHAFLFTGTARKDGTLRGDFFSRDAYHAEWTARRLENAEVPDGRPDPFSMTGLASPDGRLRFAFPDLEGRVVTQDDPRLRGKALVVNVFGSWCPNCNDEAPLLAAWRKKYAERGLEIVGLAFEMTGDAARDREFVRRFAARHGIEYPLLLAGTSDKAAASKALPDLTRVLAFPTTIFVGRDGRVRRIHTGFDGPATGAHHARLVAELEREVEGVLADRR